MSNTTKKIVDAALGVATTATETWQKNLNELVEKGKISREEGEKLLKTVEQKMKEGQEKYVAFTKNMVTSFTKNLNNPKEETTKSPEILLLEERVRVLELKMSLMARELISLQKPTTKKTTSRTRKVKK